MFSSAILENRKIFWGQKMKIFINKNVFLDLENPQVMLKVSIFMFFDPPYWKIGKLLEN